MPLPSAAVRRQMKMIRSRRGRQAQGEDSVDDSLVHRLAARIVAAHRFLSRWGHRPSESSGSNQQLDVKTSSPIQTKGTMMDPLSGQVLNDVLATRATGNWGAS